MKLTNQQREQIDQAMARQAGDSSPDEPVLSDSWSAMLQRPSTYVILMGPAAAAFFLVLLAIFLLGMLVGLELPAPGVILVLLHLVIFLASPVGMVYCVVLFFRTSFKKVYASLGTINALSFFGIIWLLSSSESLAFNLAYAVLMIPVGVGILVAIFFAHVVPLSIPRHPKVDSKVRPGR